MGLSLSDYVVTEAGFGFDLGAEKFFDIKCESSGLSPKAVVLVATVRALKHHGRNGQKNSPIGDIDAVRNGLDNLEKHIENIRHFNMIPIVAINKFKDDTAEELRIVEECCDKNNVNHAIVDVWAKGGDGATDLAEIVSKTVEENKEQYKPLYDWNWSVERKIDTIAKTIYGAKAIDYSAKAKKDLDKIQRLNLNKLPVCVAKTQNSLSDNPKLLGRPKDFIVTVREIEIASGAGFLIPITGKIMRMPGLPSEPSAEKINIDNEGDIDGLF